MKKNNQPLSVTRLKHNALTGLVIVTPIVLLDGTSASKGFAWGFFGIVLLSSIAERIIEP